MAQPFKKHRPADSFLAQALRLGDQEWREAIRDEVVRGSVGAPPAMALLRPGRRPPAAKARDVGPVPGVTPIQVRSTARQRLEQWFLSGIDVEQLEAWCDPDAHLALRAAFKRVQDRTAALLDEIHRLEPSLLVDDALARRKQRRGRAAAAAKENQRRQKHLTPSDTVLRRMIRRMEADEYGRRRSTRDIHAQLRDTGTRVDRERVARLRG